MKEIIKGFVYIVNLFSALFAAPYYRRDPEPELMVMPLSRPRAPASCLARITAAHQDRVRTLYLPSYMKTILMMSHIVSAMFKQ